MRGVFSQRGFWKLAFWLLRWEERGAVSHGSPEGPSSRSQGLFWSQPGPLPSPLCSLLASAAVGTHCTLPTSKDEPRCLPAHHVAGPRSGRRPSIWPCGLPAAWAQEALNTKQPRGGPAPRVPESDRPPSAHRHWSRLPVMATVHPTQAAPGLRFACCLLGCLPAGLTCTR